MKLLHDLFNDSFDEFFNDSFLQRTNSLMKTDIHDIDGGYLLDMELPGYQKEDIQLELKDGYLNISASRNSNNEEKDDQGNIIRKERYSGSCSRSFFVGKHVTEADIKASFVNGELKITVPKADAAKVEEKRFIPIE